jgi:hypothetical protein
LSRLIARQAEAFDAQWQNGKRYAPLSSVPADLINFLYDPVACAIATGWRAGVRIETLPIVWEIRDDYLVQRIDHGGKPVPVVVGLDSAALEEEWLGRVSDTDVDPDVR